jgi:hypothetical protein
MDLRIFLEWFDECGLTMKEMYPLQEGIEEILKEKEYGNSIKKILTVLICRPYDFRQRKRYKKNDGVFSYDILLDFYLVKHVEISEKKTLIRYQMIKGTEEAFKKYKFDDFDTKSFLLDFKKTVETVSW